MPTILTLIVVGGWLASLVVRAFSPDTAAAFSGMDPIVLMVMGWWFTRRRKENGS